MRLRHVLPLLLLVSAGCSDASATNNVTGGTAGSTCDPSNPPKAPGTIGGQCDEVLSAYCDKLVTTCGVSGTVEECRNAGICSCCVNWCSETPMSPQADIDTCTAALKATSCDTLKQGADGMPVVCRGVVKHPQ